MSIYKKLINNSLIFAIGNLGSKIISFVLVPLYTYYLTTEEYGSVDLVITTVSLLLPIISSNAYEAVLRFSLDKHYSKKSIFTNGLIIGSLGCIILLTILPIAFIFGINFNIIVYFYLILTLQFFQNLMAQFSRAIGKIKIYAVNGILMSIVLCISNVILLTIFNFGINGYLMSIVLSNFFAVIFFVISIKVWRYTDFKYFNKKIIILMLKYSVPMIPNSIMWWLINASNRYFILLFIGASANGIYAVAKTLPNTLGVFNTIFNQAWQLSAIEEYNNDDKSVFYSNVFNYYSSFLFLSSSVIIGGTKLIMFFLVEKEYYIGWQVVPFLVIGIVFSSLSGFLGTNYLAAMQTKGIFKTSIYGGIISLFLNVILIPNFGIIGASISSMLSFFVMFLMRIFDTKKYIQIKLDYKKDVVNLFIISIQILVLFLNVLMKKEIIIQIILILLVFFNNKILWKFIKRRV